MGAEAIAWLVVEACAYGLLGLACLLVLRAGRCEAQGDLPGARARSRRAGWIGGGAAATAAVAWAVAVASGWLAERPGPFVMAALLVVASGWALLLAGLSGKPRPTGWVATALWVLSAVVAISSLRALAG